MTPVNHIFPFRPNIDMINERINKKNIHNIKQLSSLNVTEAQFGCIVLDKTKKIAAPTMVKVAETAVKIEDSPVKQGSQPPLPTQPSHQVHLIDCSSNLETSSDPAITCMANRLEKNDTLQDKEEGFWIKELCL